MVSSFNLWKSTTVSTIAVISMIMSINSMVSMVDGRKLDGKIDLVLVAVATGTDRDPFYIKESIKKLPDHVEMGDENVRVAVVNPIDDKGTDKSSVVFPMSSDRGQLETWVEGWNQSVSQNYFIDGAFKICREKAFDFNNDNKRAKIVIVHSLMEPKHRDAAKKEADALRKLGVFVYIVCLNKIADDVRMWTAPARIFPVSGRSGVVDFFITEKMSEITPVIVRDVCGFCRIDEQSICIGHRHESAETAPDHFGDNYATCQSIDPIVSCEQEECEWECNRRWPWKSADAMLDPTCDRLECGPNQRKSPTPRFMEKCPHDEVDCKKPPCPTSMTTTPTAATGTDQTTNAAVGPDQSTNSAPGRQKKGGADESGERTVMFASIGAVLGVIVIVAIIFGAIFVVRKRKAARADNKLLLTRKKSKSSVGSKSKKMKKTKQPIASEDDHEMKIDEPDSKEKNEKMKFFKKKTATKSINEVSLNHRAKAANTSLAADLSAATSPVSGFKSKKTSDALKSKKSLSDAVKSKKSLDGVKSMTAIPCKVKKSSVPMSKKKQSQ